MLVLTRKPGEQVVLTDEETGREIGRVELVRVGPNTCRIGFHFPPGINIARAELLEGAAIRPDCEAVAA